MQPGKKFCRQYLFSLILFWCLRKITADILVNISIIYVSIAANVTENVTINCFDETLPTQHDAFFTDLKYQSFANGSEVITVARFQPKNSRFTEYDSPLRGRIQFLLNGKVILKQIALSDGGTYSCEGNAFTLREETQWNTTVTLYSPPTTEVNMLVETLTAGQDKTDVAECRAIGGKPAALASWLSPQNLGYNQTVQSPERTSSSGEKLMDTIATLQISPTRFHNKMRFVCNVTHESFQRSVLKAIVLNVTYPPTEPKITIDDSLQYLTCYADGNPNVTYSWILPENKTATGPRVKVSKSDDIKGENDVPTYACVVKNPLAMRTTNITYTSPTPVPRTPGISEEVNDTTPSAKSKQNGDTSTIKARAEAESSGRKAGLAVGLIFGSLILIGALVFLYLKNRNTIAKLLNDKKKNNKEYNVAL